MAEESPQAGGPGPFETRTIRELVGLMSRHDLAELLHEQNLPAVILEKSHSQAVQDRYDAYTQAAIDAGVFGAPSYVIDGEIFWGQDRLDFVERALAR